MRTLCLYLLAGRYQDTYNEALAKVEKSQRYRERLCSLRDYFDTANALWLASKVESHPVPVQIFLAAFYVVAEGFQQLGLSDAKVDALLRSPHLRLLKRLRNAVFHYQSKRANEKLLAFLNEDCLTWAMGLNAEFERWLDANVKPEPATVAAVLEELPGLFCDKEGSELLPPIRSRIASSLGFTTEEFDVRYDEIKTTAFSEGQLCAVIRSVFDGRIAKLWPVLGEAIGGLRKLHAPLERLDIDALGHKVRLALSDDKLAVVVRGAYARLIRNPDAHD